MTEAKLREVLTRLSVTVRSENARGWLVASCPFAPWLHGSGRDREPSFNAAVEPTGYSAYHCFTCKQSGTIGALVRRLAYYRGVDYAKLSIDAELYEIPDDWGDYEQRARLVEIMEPIEDADLLLNCYPVAWGESEAQSYLRGRGIGEETAFLLDLRFDPEARRIIFPVFDRHRNLYGLTGRSILPQAKIKVKDYLGLKKDQVLLGEHLHSEANFCGQTRRGVLVEGLFAEARCVESGLLEQGYCPVASMGSSLSHFQADRITDLFDELYVLYDPDKAGDDGVNGTETHPGVLRLLEGEVALFVPIYPYGLDDIDDGSPREIINMLKSAPPSVIFRDNQEA